GANADAEHDEEDRVPAEEAAERPRAHLPAFFFLFRGRSRSSLVTASADAWALASPAPPSVDASATAEPRGSPIHPISTARRATTYGSTRAATRPKMIAPLAPT